MNQQASFVPMLSQDIQSLKDRYIKIRNISQEICDPLHIEDYVVQPVVDVSPPKWHLAHTTWFFENMVLARYVKDYEFYHPDYNYFFNSYYESLGSRVLRVNRGNMTRPSVEDIYAFRKHVDQQMLQFFEAHKEMAPEWKYVIEIGLQHEQQHQELMITDIKFILGHNPLFPVYKEEPVPTALRQHHVQESYLEIPEGIYEIGYQGDHFHYDNETGRHKTYLNGFRFLNRLVTNQEYIQFIEDGGYKDHRFWLSDGWEWVKNNQVSAPLYWHRQDGEWHYYTLSGYGKVLSAQPVTHISYYEANAYAAWKGQRLLTEYEWEVAASQYVYEPSEGNFYDSRHFHPQPLQGDSKQLMGDCWEWTQSAYLQYPRYQRPSGALGEYNGKFMVNQMVLRGGSCATSSDHIRTTYRNFFHPHLQWQFSGIRVAEDL